MMKSFTEPKYLFFFIFIIVVIGFMSLDFFNSEQSISDSFVAISGEIVRVCAESDNGNNRFVAGNARGYESDNSPSVVRSDSCDPDMRFLSEYFCRDNTINVRDYDCTQGGTDAGFCFEGACVCNDGYSRVGDWCTKECPSMQNNECQQNLVCRKLFVRGNSRRWAGTTYYCKDPIPQNSVCERTDQCVRGLTCQNQRCVNAAPPDRDRDGVPDASDNCPDNQNSNQADADRDRVGDICEPREDTTTVFNTQRCRDSDIIRASGNSNDHTVRGTATGSYDDGTQFRLTDTCVNSEYLLEYFCEGGILSYYYPRCAETGNTCSSGRCR